MGQRAAARKRTARLSAAAVVRYVGIDLAWGEKNTTAAALLEGDPLSGARLVACAEALGSDAEILAFVDECDSSGGGLLVAIDAPLIVPNETGRRPCETILSACLARVQAGPHPANRARLAAPDGTVRGERLAWALAQRGLEQTPFLDALPGPPRACFEVFPHPAHVALFGLDKTLKYKLKPKRTRETRLAEFGRYADLLATLETADPPLFLNDESWWRRDPETLTPAALKRHEDALDALSCAYVALYRHRWSDERCPVVGDLATGYIVTPATPTMQACFAAQRAESDERSAGSAG